MRIEISDVLIEGKSRPRQFHIIVLLRFVGWVLLCSSVVPSEVLGVCRPRDRFRQSPRTLLVLFQVALAKVTGRHRQGSVYHVRSSAVTAVVEERVVKACDGDLARGVAVVDGLGVGMQECR